MNKYTKVVGTVMLLVLTAMCAGSAGYFFGSNYTPREIIIEPSPECDVYKTVNHIPLDRQDLELIYSDSANDIAYYRYTGERELVKPGTTVYLYDGTETKVTNTDVTGFYVDALDSVYIGMSGTIVTNSNGDTIGYISREVDGKVYCIWN